jgi:uncharacterized protein (TIGR00725 family)
MVRPEPTPVVAVVGPGEDEGALLTLAQDVGAAIARRGAIVVCGGLGGVMQAACQGAKRHGGTTVGLLPGLERATGNPWLDVAIPTGLGEARNVLVVRAADALVAVGGGYGTLSEIAFALKTGKPVVGLRTWVLTRGDGHADTGIVVADDPDTAVDLALRRPSARR